MRLPLLATLLMPACLAHAADPMVTTGFVLLEPDAVVRAHPKDLNGFGPYLGAVQSAASGVLTQAQPHPGAGYLVVAVRPGRQSAAWLDLRPALPAALAKSLVAAMRRVAPPDVQQGPVVFAVQVSVWGGAFGRPWAPEPDAWRPCARAAGRPLTAPELAQCAWPGRPGP